MKYAKCTALVFLLALAASAQPVRQKRAVPAKGAEPNQPKIIYRWDVQKSGVNDDLWGVSFVNRQVGYAVGEANTLLKTTDGGNTWTALMERKEGVKLEGRGLHVAGGRLGAGGE